MKENDEKIINELRDRMQCSKGFLCAESQFSMLCKARDFGNENYLLCLENTSPPCQFALVDDHGPETRFCGCPLRVYLAKKIGK